MALVVFETQDMVNSGCCKTWAETALPKQMRLAIKVKLARFKMAFDLILNYFIREKWPHE